MWYKSRSLRYIGRHSAYFVEIGQPNTLEKKLKEVDLIVRALISRNEKGEVVWPSVTRPEMRSMFLNSLIDRYKIFVVDEAEEGGDVMREVGRPRKSLLSQHQVQDATVKEVMKQSSLLHALVDLDAINEEDTSRLLNSINLLNSGKKSRRGSLTNDIPIQIARTQVPLPTIQENESLTESPSRGSPREGLRNKRQVSESPNKTPASRRGSAKKRVKK